MNRYWGHYHRRETSKVKFTLMRHLAFFTLPLYREGTEFALCKTRHLCVSTQSEH